MKKSFLITKVIILPLIIMGLFACEKKKDEKSKLAFLPLILPAVKETMPKGAVNASLFSLRDVNILSAATSLEALSDFFTKSFSGISGTSNTGFIATSVGDLDSRINEINSRFEDEPSCFNSTAYNWTLTTGAPVNYSIDLKLNCLDMFTQTNGDQSGAGSGMAWGRDDNYYYIALLLVQSNGTDKFGYFATYHRTTKAVDLLFLESSPSYDRYIVYRVKTDPTNSTFETAIAGSGFSEGPMFPAMGCNTRIISNGTEMLVAGKAGTTNSSGVCQTDSSWIFNSNNCYQPNDLSAAAAACTQLTTSSFSSNITEFDGTQVEMAVTNMTTNLTLSGLSGNVTAVATE